MERCIRVGAAHGFLVSRHDIIVVIAVSVVPHGSAAGDLLDHIQRDVFSLRFGSRRRHCKIKAPQCLAQIAARALCKIGTGIVLHPDGRALTLRKLFQGVPQPLLHIRSCQRFEFKHGAAGKQCIIDVKIRVLSGGGDQGHRAVLNALQQALLLLLVQILNLIEVQQDAPRPGQCADILEHRLDIPRAAGSSVELVQRHAAVLGNDAGHGGLARAGRAVKDHVGDAAALDGAAEHPPRGQQMLLAADFGQRFGAHTLRQRFIHRAFPPVLPCCSAWALYRNSIPHFYTNSKSNNENHSQMDAANPIYKKVETCYYHSTFTRNEGYR